MDKLRLFTVSSFLLTSLTLVQPALGKTCEDVFRGGTQSGNRPSSKNALETVLSERNLTLSNGLDTDPNSIRLFLERERQRNGIDSSSIPQDLNGDLKDIRRSYNDSYGELLVVKNASGNIVATAALYRSGPDEAELRKVYLSPEVAGMGLGKSLVNHLVKRADDLGYTSLKLETYAHLKEAINLYGALGFEKTSLKVKDEPDVLIFKKTLSRPSASSKMRSESAKKQYFQELHKRFVANKSKLRQILLNIETRQGADYELRQVEDTILNAATLELPNLQRTKPLSNIAVYGSTNIPLYTLVMHAFIPLTVSDAVWFRTPKATRDVYQALYEIIAMDAPPGTYAGLNLLTESRDVQYDNFRKLHVMGMNLKGTQAVRSPSEVVIFTGSPETGREILQENIKKLSDNSNFKKQLFLMFGAGMNPLVISKDAAKDLPSAVRGAMDSVLINSGQDCIAPNFLLVDEAVAPAFLRDLKNSLSKVKVANDGPADTTIKPLTFAESLDNLVDFKTQYSSHLLNKEQANIDVATKSVSPHLFVFSGDDLPKVPLREHFAPFLVVFTYKDHAQFQSLIQDPRVQQKVMYASVFGAPHATPEVSALVKLLQENRHAVSVNRSVYADESGNMAFGGIGPDSSTATLLQRTDNGIAASTAQRPLLFSEEAAREFSENVIVSSSETVKAIAQTTLNKVVSDIDLPPSALPPMLYGWANLTSPLPSNRATGLSAIRSVIKKEGLVRVVNNPVPKNDIELKRLERFYGSKLIFAADPATPRRVKGVALHVTMPEEGPNLLNRVRGTLNPHLSRGRLTGLLDGNKRLEYFLAEAIQPGSMPATETFGSLKKQGSLGTSFEAARVKLDHLVDSYLQRAKPLSKSEIDSLQAEVVQLVQVIFSSVRVRFPQGSYLKNFDDFATADLGTQITSFSSNPAHIAQQFVMRLNEVITNGRTKIDLFKAFDENPYETGSKFILYTLKNPDPIIVQVREEIAKTVQGQNLEFRVDFIDGESVHSKPRFSREFYPDEAHQAADFLNKFFKAAPPELRHMSGGADVALTKDGRWTIIEFNFGSSSGTLMPKYFIMDSHETIANLQGYDTPLLKELKAVLAKGPAATINLFRSLKRHREPWNKTSIDDLSAVELGRWIRDQYLLKWSNTNPNEQSAQAMITELESILKSRGEIGEDLQKIIEGAHQYVERKLKHQREASAARGA